MEPVAPPYVAPNFTELPKSLFMDLGPELMPIINLMIEFYPYYTEREYETTVKKLISAINHQTDIDYQIVEFSMQIMEDYFNVYKSASSDRLFEVQLILIDVARNVYNKIAGQSGYVYGVFPYTYIDMRMNRELYLKNMTHLNYDIELNRPFQFMI